MHLTFPGVSATLALVAILAMSPTTTHAQYGGGPNDSAWIQLFNKADTNLLNDWDIKITGSALNVDPRRTFRWATFQGDTVLEVNYDQYTTFNNNFGHIGYKHREFSYFIVRVEHHFYGNQVAGNPGSWALQNNGIMHHSQSAASMGLNQDFPISMEAQLLGPNNTGADPNSTMNLCTPGTAFYTTPTGGSVNTNHCVSAANNDRSQALAPNWLTVSVVAHADSIIRYYVEDQLVYTYYRPVQWSGNASNLAPGVTIVNGTPIPGGYILLQSESHGTRFRKVEVLDLEGCMTPENPNYKTYFVKHNEEACNVAGIRGSVRDARIAAPMSFIDNTIHVGGSGRVTLEAFDMRGNRIGTHTGQAPFQWAPSTSGKGLHVIRAITPAGVYSEKMTLL